MSSGILFLLIGGLLSLGCIAGAFWTLRRKRLIDDVPTSKVLGVFIGLAELKGTAESENPLTAFLSGTRCVHYIWQVDEHWTRTVVETYTDAQGRVQTRVRTESGWTKVAGGKESILFYLKDDTGVIRIVPDGAEIGAVTVFNKTCSPLDALYYEKGPAGAIANSTQRRRFYETILPLHTMLYVIGQARERQDVVAPEIAKDKNAPMFLISTRLEKHSSASHTWWYWLWLVLGLFAAAGGTIAWDMAGKSNAIFNWQTVIYSAAGFVLAVTLGWLWTVYNSLINLHHMVKQGWSQVDVQLKRRHDLIPNLVAAVQVYKTHESETHELLVRIRAQAEATPSDVAGPDFKGIAPLLTAIVERYPELKAGESFLKLQQSLVDTEQRIALARDYFNSVATFFNARLEVIPDRYVATLARLHPQTLLSASDFERAVVSVNLAS